MKHKAIVDVVVRIELPIEVEFNLDDTHEYPSCFFENDRNIKAASAAIANIMGRNFWQSQFGSGQNVSFEVKKRTFIEEK